MRISHFILVIDSYLLRKGVITVLKGIPGVRVLKEFESADPYIAYLKSHPLDYLIMGQSEFDRSIELFVARPDLLEKTILLQDFHNKGLASDSTKYEVQTSIHLQEEKDSIIHKINSLLDRRDASDAESQSVELSPRETTIVRLVSMGLTNRKIAEKLFLSAHTVMTHRKNISAKLGIKSVSGLTVYAIVNNIITIEEVSSFPSR